MGYNKELDVTLKEEKIYDGDYVVRLVQYDSGQKKIAIMKKIIAKHGETYSSKFGRLDLETARLVAKAIAKLWKEEKT